jgi:hypothetical protein
MVASLQTRFLVDYIVSNDRNVGSRDDAESSFVASNLYHLDDRITDSKRRSDSTSSVRFP